MGACFENGLLLTEWQANGNVRDFLATRTVAFSQRVGFILQVGHNFFFFFEGLKYFFNFFNFFLLLSTRLSRGCIFYMHGALFMVVCVPRIVCSLPNKLCGFVVFLLWGCRLCRHIAKV